MTTAHRPTWAPAKGHEETGGARFFAPSARRMAKDQSAHTQLKYRQDGQASARDLGERDLGTELEERERAAQRKRCAPPSTAAPWLRRAQAAPCGLVSLTAPRGRQAGAGAGGGAPRRAPRRARCRAGRRARRGRGRQRRGARQRERGRRASGLQAHAPESPLLAL